VLDAILKRYVEEAKSAAEIITETGYDAELVRDIVRKIDLNEYKRKQAALSARHHQSSHRPPRPHRAAVCGTVKITDKDARGPPVPIPSRFLALGNAPH